jgi:hypothetical protein
MMTDKTNGKLEEARAFAARVGKTEQLEQQLGYLKKMVGESEECILYPDFAPYSLYFELRRGDRRIMNGGLIFHGAHDRGGNGSGPTFSVCLEPQDGWSIHT